MYNKLRIFFRQHPKIFFELTFFSIVFLVIILALTLIFRHQGWPQNHEGLAFIIRTKIYAEHFLQADFFPIWSSADAYGMGTPLPLYYHKIFYYLSGIFLLLFGSAKLAIWLSISFFMFIGAYGMRLCVSLLNVNRYLIIFTATLFLLSNYVFSNWLVRGAMAEFSAMMIVPWLIWWCLSVIKNHKLSYSIVPIFYILFQAHNVTAIFSIFLLMLACAYYLYADNSKKSFISLLKFSIISISFLFLLLLPQIMLQITFLKDYDPSKITQMGYSTSDNFRPISSYVDSGYTWLSNWQELNTQLDVYIWLVIIAGLVLFLIRKVIIKNNKIKLRKINYNPLVLFLIATLVIYLLLQSQASVFIYESIAPMQFLQFPWRLLSYITPLSILLCVVIISWAVRDNKTIQYLITTLVLLGTILASPITNHYGYTFFSTNDINSKTTTREQGVGSDIMGIGEYLPKVYDENGNILTTEKTVTEYKRITNTIDKKNISCSVIDLYPKARFEVLEKSFKVTCLSPGYTYLPLSYNSLSTAYIISDQQNKEPLKIMRLKTDPRIRVYIPTQHSHTIIVELPRVIKL